MIRKYEKYRDSGVEWIGAIPEGWECKRFKYVFKEHSGNGFPNDMQGNTDGTIPFYKVSDLNGVETFVSDSNNYVTNEDINLKGWNLIPAETILTAKIGESLRKNHRKICKSECIIDNNCLGLEPTLISSKYAYYLLKTVDFDWFVNPGAVPSISMDKLRNFILPLSKIEQTAISLFLDRKTSEIDQLIANKEKLIALYEEEKTAVINHAVTKGLDPKVQTKTSGIDWLGDIPEHWEVKRLKYFVSKVGSGVTPKGGASVYQLDGIPLLRSQNIHFNGLRLDDVAYISQEIHEDMKNSKVLSGDVLLNITGASIGRCYFTDDSLSEANVNQHVCIIRPKPAMSTKYLFYLLRSDVGQKQIDIEQTGSGREGLNFESLKNFFLPVAEHSEQTTIVAHIETECSRLDTIIDKFKKQIDLLKEYRTTLISEVVTGKIDVRDEVAA